jgi:hypothetical protein
MLLQVLLPRLCRLPGQGVRLSRHVFGLLFWLLLHHDLLGPYEAQ